MRAIRHMKGFTLIELMVVVSIIMVLSSLLIVGISRLQKQALAVQCMNNLRMIGEAVIAYTTDIGGGLFPNFGFRDQLQNVVGLADIAAGMDERVADSWVWGMDFVDEEDRYSSRQTGVDGYTGESDQILPPRMTPKLMRCEADVQLFINGQSMLTSYWMHYYNSFRPFSSITRPSQWPLGFEADALNISDPTCCGCRFHFTHPPKQLDTTHFGGAHILFADGSVRLIKGLATVKTDKGKVLTDRDIEYWEYINNFEFVNRTY